MTRLRRVFVPLAAMWLSCQVGTVALTPVVMWVSAADPRAAECNCGHGPDAMCPMHRHKPAADPISDCSMQAANETGTAVLTTLVGAAGLIPESTPSLVAPVPSMNVGPTDVDVRGERPLPPDPPPPRV
jgi:hypothetical protein